MISNHFLCKDWVHHPIDSQPFINGWLQGVPDSSKQLQLTLGASEVRNAGGPRQCGESSKFRTLTVPQGVVKATTADETGFVPCGSCGILLTHLKTINDNLWSSEVSSVCALCERKQLRIVYKKEVVICPLSCHRKI